MSGTDPFERSSRRRAAQRRLWARRRRVGLLRARVVTVSLIGFVLLWGVVFTQMATGNDPVLSARRPAPARPREAEGHQGGEGGALAAAGESVETTEPGEAEGEQAAPSETEAVEPESEPEFEQSEPKPEFEEPEPEPESFEPEPVETAQS